MTVHNKSKNLIFAAVLSGLLFVLALFFVFPGQAARADAAVPDVLADLSSDPTFDPAIYPSIDGSYDVDIIQIAESPNGKLVVYLYVPGVDTVTVTNISISTTMGNAAKWLPYDLDLLSAEGVFQKFLVKDFTVSDKAVRFYDITELHRLFVPGVDGEALEGTEINKKAIPVAKRYTAITSTTGSVSYACEQTEVITVTAIYAGFLRYGANVFGDKACDGHYVAFSTDKSMDKLMQADVAFVTQSYVLGSEYTFDVWNTIATWFGAENTQTSVTESYGTPTPGFRTVKANENASFTTPGWFSDTYTWDRIQTASEFKTQCNLTDGIAAAIDGMDWVLRFIETDYSYQAVSSPNGQWSKDTATGTRVTDITILRLMFETQGNVYNLGVVSDIVSSDPVPDNPSGEAPQAPDPDFWDNFSAWLQNVVLWLQANWYWVLIAVVVIILLPVLCTLFPVVFNIIAAIFKGLWWIISAPFKWIYKLIHKE